MKILKKTLRELALFAAIERLLPLCCTANNFIFLSWAKLLLVAFNTYCVSCPFSCWKGGMGLHCLTKATESTAVTHLKECRWSYPIKRKKSVWTLTWAGWDRERGIEGDQRNCATKHTDWNGLRSAWRKMKSPLAPTYKSPPYNRMQFHREVSEVKPKGVTVRSKIFSTHSKPGENLNKQNT